MSLAAGELNRSIRIEKRTGAVDALNAPLDEWELVAVVWSNIKGPTGMAAIRQSSTEDGVVKSLNSYSFRIRYRPDVTSTGYRVVLGGIGGTPFDVKAIRHDLERRDWTDLICETGGNDG